MTAERWNIVNGRGQYLTVGALCSRNYIVGWTDFETAEPFRTMLEARDFIRWLGLSDVRPIDHHPHPAIPPDADTTPVRSFEKVVADAQAEDAKRYLIRRSWSLK